MSDKEKPLIFDYENDWKEGCECEWIEGDSCSINDPKRGLVIWRDHKFVDGVCIH